MSIVANEGKNVLVSYNYMLRIEGIYDLPCKAVHSFTKENEFEYLQEGGLNDYVHLLRKPISKPFTFTVERYVGTDTIPPLPLGAELILPVILLVAPLPNRFDIAKRTFVFTGCTVMSKTFGELNAEKSSLLTESIVIGYREMLEVTIPVSIGNDGPRWAFDGKKKEGNKVISAARYTRSAAGEKAAAAKKWGFSGKKKEGNAVLSAKRYTRSEEDEKAKPAKRWKFIGKTKEGNAVLSAKRYTRGEEDEKAKPAKRWKFIGKTKEGNAVFSAKKHKRDEKNEKPDQRYWSIKASPTDAQESSTEGAQSAKRIQGPSAKRMDETKPNQRRWPPVSSAKKLGKVTEKETEG